MRKSEISNLMAGWGRLGGKVGGPVGGKARMATLSPEERSELARKAAQARWKSNRKAKPKAKAGKRRKIE